MAGETLRFKLPAIRILENEHQYLSFLMADWHAIVLNIENNQYEEEEARKEWKQGRSLKDCAN